MARIIDAFTQFLDDSGDPLVGGKLAFFEPGSTTNKTTYADSLMSVPNTNPVILDGAGRCPNVFGEGNYKVVSYTSDDVQIQVFDPVGADTSAVPFGDWSNIETYIATDIVRYNNEYYRSLTNSNRNNIPTSSPTSWELLSLGRVWNDNITYDKGDSIYGSNGVLYTSVIGSNLNNNPTNQTASDKWVMMSESRIATPTGSVNAMLATIQPGLTSLRDGTSFRLYSIGENTSAAVTLNVNSLGAKTIKKHGNQALIPSDIGPAGHVLQISYNATDDVFELLNPVGRSAVLSVDNMIHVKDERTSGTSAGTFTSGSWRIRTLNTVERNTITGASLSSNQVTLPAGDYYIEGYAVTNRVDANVLRLRDLTGSADLLTGSSNSSNSSVSRNDFSHIYGFFTLGVTSALELQHYCSTTFATSGFGLAAGLASVPELYADIRIWKV